MPYQLVHGVQLYYEIQGRGKQNLVLIHGNVGSSRWWDLVLPELLDEFTVLRMDLRGAGRSERPGTGYTLQQYSKDVRDLMHQLSFTPAVVAGHSMGGGIAMDMACTEPELLQGMILINSAPAEGLQTPPERKPLIESMISDRNLMRMALAAVVPTAAKGEFFEALVDDAMIFAPAMISNYESIGESDYQELLKTSAIQTLILYGKEDSLITIEMMRRTQAVIPLSRMWEFEGIGHSPIVEIPLQVAKRIQQFAKDL